MSFDFTPQLRARKHENDSNVSSPINSTMPQPSYFHNLDQLAKTRCKKPYVPSHGSDESFAYMSPGHDGTRVNVSFTVGLAKELNDTGACIPNIFTCIYLNNYDVCSHLGRK
jgi:hypothetical protein